MLSLLKRVAGELFVLAIFVEIIYFLLLVFVPLSINQRIIIISFILVVLALFIAQFRRK